MKRKHQRDMEAIINQIITGQSDARTICAKVTPGGGKSTLPIIASKLIQAGLADGICWVVPRSALQDQGERSFLDPFFRELFNHNNTIRSSTNDNDPCRNQQGFITTYQAIGMDNTSAVQAFKSRRMIIVMDEFHHVEKDGVWHKALQPLMDLAEYRLLMTGTIERGNASQIAFVEYEPQHRGYSPIFKGDTHLIEYSRSDALKEQAILPIKFHAFDGKVSWRDDKSMHAGMLSDFEYGKKASGALYTALNTQFAKDILAATIDHWRDWNKGRDKWSKLLIVTADYNQALDITEHLKKAHHITAQRATSHDSSAAQDNIKAFKFSDSARVLVTIAMAYEGMDCPPVSHIASLTNIRSTPWIEQEIARAVRIWTPWGPYHTQTAHVFCPDDIAMRSVITRIQAEQEAVARKSEEKAGGPTKEFDPLELSTRKAPYEVIDGGAESRREIDLGENLANHFTAAHAEIKTISEQESDYRRKIESHIRTYAYKNRYDVKRLNIEVKNAFLSKRKDMTLGQLKTVLNYVRSTYPLDDLSSQPDIKSKRRGSGVRVPTKSIQWENKQMNLF